MHVTKWGDSLAIKLPRELTESLNLKDGDEVEVTVRRRHDAEADRKSSVAALRELLKDRMPADFRFDRDEANER